MKKEVYNNGFYAVYDEKNIISIKALKGGAIVVPITKDNKLILIKIYRNTIKEYSLEFPRGFVENDEDSVNGAKRELLEEIAGTATEFIHLGSSTTNNGISNEVVEYYVSTNTIYDAKKPQKEEGIVDILEFTLSDLIKMISNNEITDSFTIIALSKYLFKYHLL